MSKRVALVDVDVVVCDIYTPWLQLYNDKYNDNMQFEDITQWAMHRVVNPDCGLDIYVLLQNNSEHVYANSKPVEGALEGVKALRELGYDVKFCTSGVMPAKVKWLADNGFLLDPEEQMWTTEVIISTDKSIFKGTLIDDGQHNIRDSGDIIFDQTWNRERINCCRARGWAEVVAIMKSRMEYSRCTHWNDYREEYENGS